MLPRMKGGNIKIFKVSRGIYANQTPDPQKLKCGEQRSSYSLQNVLTTVCQSVKYHTPNNNLN